VQEVNKMLYHRLERKKESLDRTKKFKGKYWERANEANNVLQKGFYFLCGNVYLLNEMLLEKQVTGLQRDINAWRVVLAGC